MRLLSEFVRPSSYSAAGTEPLHFGDSLGQRHFLHYVTIESGANFGAERRVNEI